MNFYLYRFVDANGEILYIGRTNDIYRRILKEHFADITHLPSQCYLETEKVEYTKVNSESEEVAYEAILINEIRPKYNKQFKDQGCFQVQVPKFEWMEFQWEYEGQLEWLKKKKAVIINSNDVIINYLAHQSGLDIKTGIIDIDSGMLISQQSFTLIAGVSGSGKTLYTLNIANNNVKEGKCVLFINLKDSVEELSMKLLSINSKIPIYKLLMKQMEDKEWKKCAENIKAKKNTSLFFYNITSDHWNLDKVISVIRDSNADLVIIDDLQIIKLEQKEMERETYNRDKLDYILKVIKKMSVLSGIPVIGTYCITAKKVNSRQDHRPILSDFEYDSLLKYPDNIQLLYRNDMYWPYDKELANIVEIYTAKNLLNHHYCTRVVCTNGMYANIEDNKKVVVGDEEQK